MNQELVNEKEETEYKMTEKASTKVTPVKRIEDAVQTTETVDEAEQRNFPVRVVQVSTREDNHDLS